MATFLLTAIAITTVASALAARRGRVHGVFYWRGLRNLVIAGLALWSTFADGPVIRTVGLVVAAGLVGLAALQLVLVKRVRREPVRP